MRGLDSLAQDAAHLAMQGWGTTAILPPSCLPASDSQVPVEVNPYSYNCEGGTPEGHLSMAPATATAYQLVTGLQEQALALSAELLDSRAQLQALQARAAERAQGDEVALAMARAAERQSDMSLHEVRDASRD